MTAWGLMTGRLELPVRDTPRVTATTEETFQSPVTGNSAAEGSGTEEQAGAVPQLLVRPALVLPVLPHAPPVAVEGVQGRHAKPVLLRTTNGWLGAGHVPGQRVRSVQPPLANVMSIRQPTVQAHCMRCR